MLGKIFAVLVTISFIFAIINGSMEDVSRAAAESAASAVELTLSLLGSMCLWNGTARVLDKGGFTSLLARPVMPFLKFAYPDLCRKNNGIKECIANISANFLGLGNAALPTGISAMKRICENSIQENDRASDEAVMFAVLATTPFQLLPNTLAAMREAAGSASPYEILLPVWICEVLTTVFAVLLCKIMAKLYR